MTNFSANEWYEIMLAGETFVQTIERGDVFLGSFGHSPFVRDTWQDDAWQHGFLNALPEYIVTGRGGKLICFG
jgi:hypothetical protein